ncbi:MAG: ATP-binding protein [Gemmatimonadota bacterium]
MPGGSGIGLALGRQIVEAHGGTLAVQDREEVRGCIARVRLPLARK